MAQVANLGFGTLFAGVSLNSIIAKPREAPMKRREFLKSMTAVAAGGMVSAPAIWSPAKAQSRQETLLFITESGPDALLCMRITTFIPIK